MLDPTQQTLGAMIRRDIAPEHVVAHAQSLEAAVDELKAQCQGGKIIGVFTKDQTMRYFLVFKREAIVRGYCNQVKAG